MTESQSMAETHPMTEKCPICMQLFVNPVIGMDGNVYCENCIIEWNKKNNHSPSGGDRITKWITCPLFNRLYLSLHIVSDLNILKLIDVSEFECENKEEALQIINMIDNEHFQQQAKIDHDDNVRKIFTKIFINSMLINSIIGYLSDTWISRNGYNISYYVLKYGSFKSVQFMVNKNMNLILESFKIMNDIKPFSQLNRFNSSEVVKFIELIIKFIDPEHTFGKTFIHCLFNKENNLTSSDQLKVIELITKRVSKKTLDLADEKQMSPIHYVCGSANNMISTDRMRAIKLLIECKVDLNQADSKGFRPINYICDNNVNYYPGCDCESMIKFLINQENIELFHRDKDNKNLLHHIVCNKNIASAAKYELIKLLIDRGIEINANDCMNKMPIHYLLSRESEFLSSDRLAIVKLMIDRGLKIDENNKENDSMISYVCGNLNRLCSLDQLEMLRLLFPFFTNVFQSSKEIVKNAITNICSQNNNFRSREQLEAIKLLIKYKANLSMKNHMGEYPVHYVCGGLNKFDSNDQLEAIKLLLIHGVDFNVVNDQLTTPMHLICSRTNFLNSSDQLKCIKLLIEHKINFEVPNKRLWRGIQYVSCKYNRMISNDQLEALKALINYGVNVNSQDDNGWAPLHDVTTIDGNNFDDIDQITAIKLLINKGADVSIKCKKDVTPLHNILLSRSISDNSRSEIIKMLISRGTDIRFICDFVKNGFVDESVRKKMLKLLEENNIG